MKVYYLQNEYEPGKHRIIKAVRSGEYVDETVMAPFLVLDIDESTNAKLCFDLSMAQNRTDITMSGKYYVTNGVLTEQEGWVEYMPTVF